MGRDWFPRRRDEAVLMAEEWEGYITPARATAWGVPAATLTELTALKTTAKALLEIVEGPEGNDIKTAECRTAFNALRAAMRDLKRRHFFQPPLTEADYAALNLPQPDHELTEIPVPAIHVLLVATPRGNREIEITRTVLETGSRAVPYGMLGAALYEKVGGPAPAGPEDLKESRRLNRHRTTRVYTEEDRRKPVWYAARWINEKGQPGPWSDVVETTIP